MEAFLVLVFMKPTDKEAEDGKTPKIIVQPTAVMANDSNQACLKAWRLIPQDFNGADDRLEVRVLPFQRRAS